MRKRKATSGARLTLGVWTFVASAEPLPESLEHDFAEFQGVPIGEESAVWAFPLASAGLLAAIELQLSALEQVGAGLPLAVTACEVLDPDRPIDSGVFESAVRLAQLAQPEQILVDGAASELARPCLPAGVDVVDVGSVTLDATGRRHRVFQLRHPQLRHHFEPVRSAEAAPSNLPPRLSVFIGRYHEQDEVLAALRSQRAVVVHGAGGIGKSALALILAYSLVDDQPDGAWWVPVANHASLWTALSQSIGISASAGKSIESAVLERLKDRAMLLVLDGCERTSPAFSREVEQLLKSAPELLLLLTSRRAMSFEGGGAVRLGPLECPPAHVQPTSTEAMAFDAVALFCERATATRPVFELHAGNLMDVIRLCRRLEGNPQAIEWAASRMDTMSPADVLAHWTDAQGIEAVAATLTWTLDLLSLDERCLLERLSILDGDFSVAIAREIAGFQPGLRPSSVSPLVTSLVGWSLLELAEPLYSESFYRLPSLVREHVLREVHQGGVPPELSARFLAWAQKVASDMVANLQGPEAEAWIPRYRRIEPLLQQALDWLLAESDPQPAYAIVSGLQWLFIGSSQARRNAEMGRRFLDQYPEAPYTLRASVLEMMARSYLDLYERADARRAIVLARRFARLGQDSECEARVLATYSRFGGTVGGPELGIKYALQALKRTKDPRQKAGRLISIASDYRVLGQLDQAFDMLGQARRILGQSKSLLYEAYLELHEGFCWSARENGERALAHFYKAVVAFEKLGNDDMVTTAALNAGRALYDQGRFHVAALLAEATRRRVSSGTNPYSREVRDDVDRLLNDCANFLDPRQASTNRIDSGDIVGILAKNVGNST